MECGAQFATYVGWLAPWGGRQAEAEPSPGTGHEPVDADPREIPRGRLFGGIASFSVHGWIWAVMAIGGTFAGPALRPVFGLRNTKPTDSVC